MADYGYVRVSTSTKQKKIKKINARYEEVAKQDYERQRFIFSNANVKFDKIFEEHISGGVRGDKRDAFNDLLSIIKEGDTIHFTETSRFGRNYKDNFEIIDMLTLEYKVNVHFISNNILLEGGEKLNPYVWLNLSNCFVIDEFQKRLIGFNTSNKLQSLKSKGVKLGAPCKISQDLKDEAINLYKKGLSQNQISKQLGISRTVIANQIKSEVV